MKVGGRYAMTMIIAGGRWSGTGSWLVLVLGRASRVALSLIDCFGWHQLNQSQEGPLDLCQFQQHHPCPTNNSICLLAQESCPLSPSDGVF
jgi:hypothetical protein